jgi:hypothetical protein
MKKRGMERKRTEGRVKEEGWRGRKSGRSRRERMKNGERGSLLFSPFHILTRTKTETVANI